MQKMTFSKHRSIKINMTCVYNTKGGDIFGKKGDTWGIILGDNPT